MRTQIFPGYLQMVLSLPRRLAMNVADRIDRLTVRIDAADFPCRHQLGAWESFASFRARDAQNASKE